MERVGTLLWELRTEKNWSLGALSRRSGVSKAALSQWESDSRQPRIPELEAVLDALGADAAQRTRLFASINAPRALRHLRRLSSVRPPTLGDLIQSLRHRKGWTQSRIAERLGVHVATIARWERGERLPSVEQIQSLCYHLGAGEEEFIALTTGDYTEKPSYPAATCWEEKKEELTQRVYQVQFGGREGRQELDYWILEREAWEWAMRTEEAKPYLAHIYATHAQCYRTEGRWADIGPLVQQSQGILPAGLQGGMTHLWCVLLSATAAAYGGRRSAPQRGIRLLRPWAIPSTDPAYRAWILSDMAEYALQEGRTEEGLSVAAQAISVAEQSANPIEALMRRMNFAALLLSAGRPGQALDALPDVAANAPSMCVECLLIHAEAQRRLENLAAAQEDLQSALTLIEATDAKRYRPRAAALAALF